MIFEMLGLVLHTFRRTFDVKGRSGRREFWTYFAFLTVAWIIVGLSANCLNGSASEEVSGLIKAVATSVVTLPGIALIVRRLHDRSIQARQYCLMFAALLVASAVWFYVGLNHLFQNVLVAFFTGAILLQLYLTTFIAIIVRGLRSGTVGPNRYGEQSQ